MCLSLLEKALRGGGGGGGGGMLEVMLELAGLILHQGQAVPHW